MFRDGIPDRRNIRKLKEFENTDLRWEYSDPFSFYIQGILTTFL